MVTIIKYGVVCALGFVGGFYSTSQLMANLIKSGRMQDIINEYEGRQRA